jgi:hypothetical protein
LAVDWAAVKVLPPSQDRLMLRWWVLDEVSLARARTTMPVTVAPAGTPNP